VLSLVSYQRRMWDELWRWQAARVATVPRPPEPERALFVADVTWVAGVGGGAAGHATGTLAAGIALHETKAYIFLDDLTTNPAAPLRLRHAGATLVLATAKQYCLSVGKPACAFTSYRGLYKIARRLGFEARPSGALLVWSLPHEPFPGEFEARVVAQPRETKKGGPVAKPARHTVDGENVYERDRHPSNGKVSRQVVREVVKSADGKTITLKK
jgi:hypothetical protein